MLRATHLLRSDKLAAYLTDHPVPLTVVICVAWTLLGLLGHDPWKPDEAHTFGVVYQMLQNGDWVVPMLAAVSENKVLRSTAGSRATRSISHAPRTPA